MKYFTDIIIARVNQGLELALGDLESGSSFSLTIDTEVDGLPSLRPPPPIFNRLFRSQRAQTRIPDRTHDDDSLIPPPITKLLDDHTVNAESHAGKEETDSAPCLDGGTRSEEQHDQDQREGNGSAD
jgi:hypothetical protein